MTPHDIVEINQLAIRYAAAVDRCDVAAFQAVFHRDARLHSYHPDADAPFADLRGHEQLARIPDAMRGMYRHTTHMLANHLVDVDGDAASGEMLCTARHLREEAGEAVSINGILRYVDRYVRHAGKWLIADRQIRFLWNEHHPTSERGVGRGN